MRTSTTARIAAAALALGAVTVATVDSARATATIWDGSDGTTTLISDPANWQGDVAPSPGDHLVFPAGAVHKLVTVPTPAGPFGSVRFEGGGYVLPPGSQLHAPVLDFAHGAGEVAVGVRVDSASDLDVHVAPGGHADVATLVAPSGTITLDVDGTLRHWAFMASPTVRTTGSGRVTFNGSGKDMSHLEVAGGTTIIGTGAMTHVTVEVIDGTFGDSGENAVSSIVASGGTVAPGAGAFGGGMVGTLGTSSLDLRPGATLAISFRHESFGSGYDRVIVSGGPVVLGGALQVELTGSGIPMGFTMPIVVNQSDQPVAGTFAGLPEGSILAAGDHHLLLSYVGGDGNDVTLTRVPAPPADDPVEGDDPADDDPGDGDDPVEGDDPGDGGSGDGGSGDGGDPVEGDDPGDGDDPVDGGDPAIDDAVSDGTPIGQPGPGADGAPAITPRNAPGADSLPKAPAVRGAPTLGPARGPGSATEADEAVVPGASSPELPRTGTATALSTGAAIVLLGLGAALVLAGRRASCGAWNRPG